MKVKRAPSLSIIPLGPPSRRASTQPAQSDSPDILADSRNRGHRSPSRSGNGNGYMSPRDEDSDGDRSYASAASVRSEHSYRSTSTAGSRKSNTTRERVDRKLQKPDYGYHYNCKSGNDSIWVAEFNKPLEEFIYPSLQNRPMSKEKKKDRNRPVSRNNSTKTIEPAVQDYLDDDEVDIELPRWRHYGSHEKTLEQADEKQDKFLSDLHKGEKFIRESLQRNYRKRLKQEADAEKRKRATTASLKKAKKLQSKFTMLENSVGVMLGDNNAFFLPKPADEVVRCMFCYFTPYRCDNLFNFALRMTVQIINYKFTYKSKYRISVQKSCK